jgi:hypothetical protein
MIALQKNSNIKNWWIGWGRIKIFVRGGVHTVTATHKNSGFKKHE